MTNTSIEVRVNRGPRAVWLAGAAALLLAACGGADESLPSGAGGVGPDTGTGGSGAVSTGEGGGGAGDVGGSSAGGSGAGGLNVAQLAVGVPTFNVVDFQLFSAPLGTVESEFVERKATTETVMPRHEFLLDIDLLAPVEAMAPPYEGMLEAGVLAAGFVNKERHLASDWTAPQGIYLGALIVPAEGAAQGSSSDFEAGAIVPNAIFPITVDVDLWKGGAVFDPDFDFDYPTTDVLMPETTFDGYSHMPLFFWRNTDMIAGAPDTYQFRMRIVDAQGNGWRVFIPLFVE